MDKGIQLKQDIEDSGILECLTWSEQDHFDSLRHFLGGLSRLDGFLANRLEHSCRVKGSNIDLWLRPRDSGLSLMFQYLEWIPCDIYEEEDGTFSIVR